MFDLVLAHLVASASLALPPQAERAGADIAAVERGLEDCKAALGDYPEPAELQDCDFAASLAARQLTPRSSGNAGLAALWPALFDRLMGEDDALTMRVVIAAEGSAFEIQRAAILTDAPRAAPPRKFTDVHLLGLLKASGAQRGLVSARELLHGWQTVRNADCAAYPVPDCAARLNAAFGTMLAALSSDADEGL
jgi:hypothetical protein